MIEGNACNDEVMRLLNIGDFKKRYLEKSMTMRAKINPTLMKLIRDIEDGLCDITELDLSNSNLNDQQLAPILETLKGDMIIHSLNLSNNNIRSLEMFNDLLRVKGAITKLDLSNNPIDYSQIDGLIETAKRYSNITYIDFRNDSYPNNKHLINYTLRQSNMQSMTLAGSPNRKGVLLSSLQSSLNSTDRTASSSTRDVQSTTSSRGDPNSRQSLDLSKAKMSRMEWILHLKKICNNIKSKNSARTLTIQVLIEHIYASLPNFPLVDENIYKHTNTEMGFSAEEIIRKMQERLKEAITYDDILDAISQINQKDTTKPLIPNRNISANTNGRTTPTRQMPQNAQISQKITGSQSKENDYQNKGRRSNIKEVSPFKSRKSVAPLVGLTSNASKEKKGQNYFLPASNKANKSLQLSYKPNKTYGSASHKTKEEDLLDELYAQDDGCSRKEITPSNIKSNIKQFEVCSTSFQRFSEDMNNIGDYSAIEQTEKSYLGSDWLGHNESQYDNKQSNNSEIILPPLNSEREDTSSLKPQYSNSSNFLFAETSFSIEKSRSDNITKNYNASVFSNSSGSESIVYPKPCEEADADGLKPSKEVPSSIHSRQKSTKMLKQFLSNKVKPELPKKQQTGSFAQENSASKSDMKNKNFTRELQASYGSSRSFALKPPLTGVSQTLSVLSNSTEKGFTSPKNQVLAQKVPITKVSLGKDSENTSSTPSKLNFQQRDLLGTQAITPESKLKPSESMAKIESQNPNPNNKLLQKFLELLTSFNTFYNENSSLISSTDINFINMINNYSIKKFPDNESKISVCFSDLRSIEVKEMLIYPLLRTILSYVEVLRIEKSLLSQESFAELVPESLLVLDLSGNKISDLRCLKTCRNLEFINLSNNHIEEAKGFIMCPKLKEIILSSNRIKGVKNLSKLSELRLIDLSDNLIEDQTSLQSLQQNTQLNCLNLKGNPISFNSRYRKEVFAILPHIKYLDAALQDVTEYIDHFEAMPALIDEDIILPKKLSTSKSFSALTTTNLNKRGVLKNSASNLNLFAGLSNNKSFAQSRSITPSATRKTSFFQDLEQSEDYSEKFNIKSYKSRGLKCESVTDEVLTITLDINNLNL